MAAPRKLQSRAEKLEKAILAALAGDFLSRAERRRLGRLLIRGR